MAAGPIRFRCSQCQQLLGVARSRAGTVVACPRCSADNFVPFEDQSIPPPPPKSGPAPALVSTKPVSEPPIEEAVDPASGIDPDLLKIRPEDIRVEPGLRSATPTNGPSEPPPTPEPPVAPEERETDEEYSVEEEIPAPPPAPLTATSARARTTPPAGPVQPSRIPGTGSTAAEPIVPPIRIDEPIRTSRAPQPVILRPRDLIVPRSVVATWSILVLVAVAFAFASGLLIGHYVWGVH